MLVTDRPEVRYGTQSEDKQLSAADEAKTNETVRLFERTMNTANANADNALMKLREQNQRIVASSSPSMIQAVAR